MRGNLSKNVVIVLALAAAGVLVTVRRVIPALRDDALYSDGSRIYSTTGGEGVRYAVWDPPEWLPGPVNTPARESRPALSIDGRWLVFAVGEEGLNTDLWIAELRGGQIQEPQPLTGLNTDADELAPAFAGEQLFFASNRDGGQGGYDLYVCTWDGLDPGPASPVDGANTTADEVDPAPGEALAFASNRADGGRGDFDLYALYPGTGEGAPEVLPLAELNTPFEEREPAFAADGRMLLFASDRERPGGAAGAGSFDLYRSALELGEWLPPEELEGLNTSADERGPLASSDGFTVYFERGASELSEQRPAGDLFRARSVELFRLPPPKTGWLDLVILAALLTLALLAWLAKRWHTLDVIYKCFLASLVVHLLLLWLLREVYPEGDPVDLGPGREPAFRVRVLERAPSASLRERGGALELAHREVPAVAQPTRETTGAVAPTPSSAAPATGRIAHQSKAQPVPERFQTALQRTERARALEGPQLADRERVERRRAEAAREVAPGMTAASLERPATAPARAGRATLEGRAPESREAPEVVRVQRVQSREPELQRTFQSAAAAPTEVAREARTGPALRAPTEDARRRAAPASEPTLEPAAAAVARFEPGRPGVEVAPVRLEGQEQAPAAEALAAPEPAQLTRSVAGSETAAPAPRRFSASELAPRAPSAPRPGPELAAPARATRTARSDLAPEPALPEPTGLGFARSDRPAPAQPGLKKQVSVAATTPPEETLAPELRRLEPERPDVSRELPVSPERQAPGTYRSRYGTDKEVALESFGGGADTERAVESGLAYLAGKQRRSGMWGSSDQWHAKYRQIHVGNSALCMLAFLGAGHTHRSDTDYSENVGRVIEWLLSVQDRRTGHFGNSTSYSHGIATYALAECYALTGDSRLRRPLERAVAQILANQFPSGRGRDERLAGGWSYYYPDGSTYDAWPRVSITSWQVMALESARLSGLAVPEEALASAADFIARSWDSRLGAMRYSHDPQRLRSGYPTLPGSTPAGLFALSILGEDIADARFEAPRSFVLQRVPDGFSFEGDDAFVFRAQGNVYFWYYGSLAMLRAGGSDWQRWNTALKETLLPAQQSDGSWRPLDVYAEYAGDTRRESIYTTAMCVLTLEVYYRYFTPLLEKE